MEDKIEVGGDLTIIDVQSGRQRLLRASEKEVMQSPTPSPDGRMVATGMSAPNSIVRLWEVITGKQTISLQGLKGGVGKIAGRPTADLWPQRTCDAKSTIIFGPCCIGKRRGMWSNPSDYGTQPQAKS